MKTHRFILAVATVLIVQTVQPAAWSQISKGYRDTTRCAKCGTYYSWADLKVHLPGCGKDTGITTCLTCGRRMPLYQFREHSDTCRPTVTPETPSEQEVSITVTYTPPAVAEQEMSVTYTPNPVEEAKRPDPNSPSENMPIGLPLPEASLGGVKAIFTNSKLAVTNVSTTELSVSKNSDGTNPVRIEHRKDKNQVLFVKHYRIKQDAEEIEILRLANQLNSLNKPDVHCNVEDTGDSKKQIVLLTVVNVTDGLKETDLVGAFANMQKALLVVRTIDKNGILTPVEK